MKQAIANAKLPNIAKPVAERDEGRPAAYSPPRLERIADADALLQILGPAQAFYRGPGFNP